MRAILYILLLGFIFTAPPLASSLDDPGKKIDEEKIGFVTELGRKIDTSLLFHDQNGKEIALSALLSPGTPTILLPVYYGCPRLCGLLLNGFIDLVKAMELTMGVEYKVITVSFDPLEKPELALAKSNTVFRDISREDVNASNWHFLVGNEQNIKALMEQVGFRYEKDGEEYAHASGFIVLTPDGEISQYFTGILFPSWDVRLSLIEASKGSIGSAIDHILLFCYNFDPSKGKYTWVAFNVLRGGVLVSVLLCFALVYIYSRRAKRA